MLDTNQLVLDPQSSIAQWVYTTIGASNQLRLRSRLKGNDLHILCESSPSPEPMAIMPQLVKALHEVNGVLPNSNTERPIYKLIIYGRTLGSERTNWMESIHLNQLEQHLERWYPTKNSNNNGDYLQSVQSQKSALIVSNESLARSGDGAAIARYLSESLSSLGVGVKVFIQILANKSRNSEESTENPNSSSSERRLWIICDSDYNPDPSLLAEPVAKKLRNLKLTGFQDAVLRSQVSGEAKPDLLVRIDLTPPEEMLKDWARWGDEQSLSRLLNHALADNTIKVRLVLKDTTLHLFCSRIFNHATAPMAPSQERTMKIITPLLESLSPQGIHRATVYGIKFDHQGEGIEQEKPAWIAILNLPAAFHPALAESTEILAQQGNKPALLFLLQRILHPDLDWRLATGGIRLQIHRKHDLLHIISEALTCPVQSQVGPPIAKFIRQLRIPKIAGVRVYGRYSGQSSPLWNYGIDFITRKRLSEQTPQFAPTSAWAGNDLPANLDKSLSSESASSTEIVADSTDTENGLLRKIEEWLLASQLFISTTSTQEITPVANHATNISISAPRLNVAVVWGILGLLLMLQSDWLIGQILRNSTQLTADVDTKTPIHSTSQSAVKSVPIPQMSLQKSKGKGHKVFNGSGFTRQGDTSLIFNNSANSSQSSAAKTAILAAARSPNPSFRNRLLDEKLAIYQQRLQNNGGIPPDVLIVGSSRAMRGIDPAVLKTALIAKGYNNIDIFNFGVNGATAQVVDLMLRRILTSSQLPKLIIWADGARAFNSGRMDLTYEAMTNSPGYQKLEVKADQETHLSPISAKEVNIKPPTTQPNVASAINGWLNQILATISTTYPQREQLKNLLRDQFAQATKNLKQETKSNGIEDNNAQPLSLEDAFDFDGFMPLSVRFNPKNYYQKYSKVTGDYDNDYESFNLNGQQNTALESLLQFSQTKQIPLVFINVPLTKEYLDPVRSKYEQKFQEYMRNVALQKGLIFRDLSQLFPNKNEYFSDPSHLNRYGASEVSKQLAQDPMIPWSIR